MRFTRRGLGGFRLGLIEPSIERRAGKPSMVRGRVSRWCVRGGGSVRVMYGRDGRALAIASTARGHHAGRVAPRARLRSLRRAYPHLHRIRRGMYVTRRGSRVVFGLRAGRVRYVAVATRKLARHPKRYRANLVRAQM
jgi:hypothetical protein